jgi:hypothetical protein
MAEKIEIFFICIMASCSLEVTADVSEEPAASVFRVEVKMEETVSSEMLAITYGIPQSKCYNARVSTRSRLVS